LIDLLTAKDDFLKQEDVVLAVNVCLGDNEDVVKEEVAKVGEVMPLPVLNARLQVLYRRLVLRPSLCLVNFIRDTFSGGSALLELVVIRVVLGIGSLDQRLEEQSAMSAWVLLVAYVSLLTSSKRGYLQIRCTGLIKNAGSSDLALISTFWD
jgi:hypothetical protein